MIKTGYKVVQESLQSVISKDWAVFYKVGRSVTPQRGCGPLTVFKCIEGAVHFRRRMILPLRIFKCFYIQSADLGVWGIGHRHLPLIELEQTNNDCILLGSVDLADEVILTEEL